MDKETVEHIFEPFFTTKEMGRGTGLRTRDGVRDSQTANGHITVYSEVGKGTTFRVYLPAIPGEVETEVEDHGIMPAFGTETVLLVDDEEFVRELGRSDSHQTRIHSAPGGQRQRGARSLQEGTFTDITGDSRLDHAGDGRHGMSQGASEDRSAGERSGGQRVFCGCVSERDDSNGRKRLCHQTVSGQRASPRCSSGFGPELRVLWIKPSIKALST